MSVDLKLNCAVPWIVVAAMMRTGDKLASYRALALTLGQLTDLPWQAVIVGDGAARSEVEAAIEGAAPGRSRFLGEREPAELAQIYSACDLCIWPAVNEAYGMAMLEAQAAGVPVVSHAVRGVPDVVCDGRTGLLAPAGNADALAGLSRMLLTDHATRLKMGREANRFVSEERSVASASAVLHRLLTEQAGEAAAGQP
jgi:glycosyltransferase involved in cell wall biosynthesis